MVVLTVVVVVVLAGELATVLDDGVLVWELWVEGVLGFAAELVGVVLMGVVVTGAVLVDPVVVVGWTVVGWVLMVEVVPGWTDGVTDWTAVGFVLVVVPVFVEAVVFEEPVLRRVGLKVCGCTPEREEDGVLEAGWESEISVGGVPTTTGCVTFSVVLVLTVVGDVTAVWPFTYAFETSLEGATLVGCTGWATLPTFCGSATVGEVVYTDVEFLLLWLKTKARMRPISPKRPNKPKIQVAQGVFF